jgi:UDP-glucose 4-epimerase
MRILLTGGLGFIGSHTAVVLSNLQFEVIIIDNLLNSSISVLENIKKLSQYPDNIYFFKGDLNNKTELLELFSTYTNIDAVIHFASLKAVNESIRLPLLYYKKNINGLIHLLEVMDVFNCDKIIFSSSATVYGNNDTISALKENTPTGQNITNPYGQTKYFQEQILKDYIFTHPKMCVAILRYFNPVGAHPSGLLGENPKGIPNNLFPYLLKVVSKEYECLHIFGNNYNTPDGTCVRDFIHVMDLAEGHAHVLSHMKQNVSVYNLGTGKGTSVLELIQTFEKVNNVKIPYVMDTRRTGDIETCYADVSKIYNEIGWKSKYTMEDVCRDGYHYLQSQHK